jgi:hypothetical protein
MRAGTRPRADRVDRLPERVQQPLGRIPRVLAHPEHAHQHVVARQLDVHVVLLAHEPRQLEAADARAAHVDREP